METNHVLVGCLKPHRISSICNPVIQCVTGWKICVSLFLHISMYPSFSEDESEMKKVESRF